MKEYRKAIFAHYEAVKNDRYPDVLLYPTTATLKTLCTVLFDTLSPDDKIIYARFFKADSPVSTLDFNDVKTFDVDKFRPLVRFLKGGSAPTNPMAIELLAIMVDFRYRPLKKFSRQEVQEFLENNEPVIVSEPPAVYGKESEEGGNEDIINEEDLETTKATVVGSTRDKFPKTPDAKTSVIPQKIFATPGRQNSISSNQIKWAVLVLLVVLAGIYLIQSVFQEKGCMVWRGDHYEEVPCDLQVNSFAGNKVIPVKKDLLMYQKKIIVTDTTTFFNPDATVRIWYGKSAQKDYEYFTYPGKHPETNKDLKSISHYIIDNHIKKGIGPAK